MKINLIAVGKKMPTWVVTSYQDYVKRLPTHLQLKLHEIALPSRDKGKDIDRLMNQEGQAILQMINSADYVVALDVQGESWSTPDLAKRLQQWQQHGQDISLIIGGPDGLAANCLQRANIRWSLSRLTLPHPLVRIIVAEQLYRAWSILSGHPYHRN